VSALADTAGGMAVWSGIDDDRSRVSTIRSAHRLSAPRAPRDARAEATVVRLGNRVGVADVRLFHPDAEADTVATGKGVYNVKIVKPKT